MGKPTIRYHDADDVEVRLTCDQLGTLRYSMAHAADQLEQTARFLKSMKLKGEFATARKTARDARKLSEDIEKAMKSWMSHR